MDILVVGGGGREHALVWALRRSPSIDHITCAPGNAGIAALADCVDVRPGDLHGLARLASERGVDLVVVGPEAPLASGLADLLDTMGIPCFGPRKGAAIIEGSKAFAKSFMLRHGIPTPDFEIFKDATAALDFVAAPRWGFPTVVKADGLAAGKGVTVCHDAAQAAAAVRAAMVEGSFGGAGSTVVVEAFARGAEVTIMALCDGTRLLPLVPSQDHKQALDGDQGPNTGGMGAYAPAHAVADQAMVERVVRDVLEPTMLGLAAEGRPFSGVLYAGMVIADDTPTVLEFNCRFGDPEAQAVIPLLQGDFAELLAGIADGEAPASLQWRAGHCACVVLAAEGYPGKYRHGDAIRGLDSLAGRDDVVVFHSGTSLDGDRIVTSGGRVLAVSGLGDTLEAALATAYAAIDGISFPGMHYRKDIGRRRGRA